MWDRFPVLKRADSWKQPLKSDRAKVHTLIGITSWAGLKWVPLMHYHVCIYSHLEKVHHCWHKYLCILVSLSSEIQNFPSLFYDLGNFSASTLSVSENQFFLFHSIYLILIELISNGIYQLNRNETEIQTIHFCFNFPEHSLLFQFFIMWVCTVGSRKSPSFSHRDHCDMHTLGHVKLVTTRSYPAPCSINSWQHTYLSVVKME